MAGLGRYGGKLDGDWAYRAGTSGTVDFASVPTQKRILNITATAPTTGNGSITINGGDAITVPAGLQFNVPIPEEKLVDPVIVFTGTDSYYVDWLQ